MALFALPALGAVGSKIGTALAALKAGGIGKAAAKAGMGTYKALKGAGVPKGISRFAGDKVMKVGRSLSTDGFAKNLGMPMTKQDIAMAVAPDLLFGGIAAATTEGDIVDKALAGTGSAAGGIVGGIGLRGVLGPKSGLGILGTEMVGGIMGDQAGYGIANNIIRAKNGGMTPAEKTAAELDGQYRQQIIDQYLRDQGLA